MLPDIDLDNERFDDILENAKNSIVSSCPEWTDFNYHDPGITILEMTAWLKELQQYYLNKTGPAHIRRSLKLFGVQRRPKCPSSTEVSVRYSDDLVAARGTRLYAGDICFEAEKRTYISSARLICCICKDRSRSRIIDQRELSFGGNLRIDPFPGGRNSEFYIGFDKPLEKDEQHALYIEINDKGEIKRNPITDPESFIPLVDISAEYYSERGWVEISREDMTFGFLTSGLIRLTPTLSHKETKVAGKKAYFIRFRLTGGEYDIQPQIRNIEFNLLPVVQRETMAECLDLPAGKTHNIFSDLAARGNTFVYLKGKDGMFTVAGNYEKRIDETTGEVQISIADTRKAEGVRIVNYDPSFAISGQIGVGTGLPFQKYSLETDRLEYDSFRIMTELPASGGKLVEWKKVQDFSTAKAEDFVYVLDTAKGEICFGSCIRGMAPEGRIFIVGCSYTYGANGNVSVGSISRMNNMPEDSISITNTRRSEGGHNEETIENCCVRVYRMMQTTETLVTDEDHENYIMGIQGLKIEKCHMMRADPLSDRKNDPLRTIIVKPYSPDGRGIPGERYCRNILAALEKRRMLGTGFRIARPEYAGVRVYADISVERSSMNAKQELQRVISEYFEECKNRFGIKLIYSRLYERIDRLSFVVSVNALTMETPGSGAQRTREGDLLLSPNVMAFLSETELMVTSRR